MTPLLAWYDKHARALPWRSPPHFPPPDPYRVWLSEIMLQQTTVASVRSYFERFTARWPTVAELAAASDADLMAAWAGLGYYARARNLLACARAVIAEHGGRFPRTEAELRTLPGVGAYTAAAIAAIAFDQRATVVDGNVERVIARLFAVDTPLPAARPILRAHAEVLTPADRPGDHAQAMMDLGATICTPRTPACPACPLRVDCKAADSGDPERFPIKAAKRAKPHRYGVASWIERNGAILLITRPASGLLGGMRALPSTDWTADPQTPPPGMIVLDQAVRHVFSHFTLDLSIAIGTEKHCAAMPAGEWWPLPLLDEAGLPTVFAKAAAVATERDKDVRTAA